jgi:hypothetical protein
MPSIQDKTSCSCLSVPNSKQSPPTTSLDKENKKTLALVISIKLNHENQLETLQSIKISENKNF